MDYWRKKWGGRGQIPWKFFSSHTLYFGYKCEWHPFLHQKWYCKKIALLVIIFLILISNLNKKTKRKYICLAVIKYCILFHGNNLELNIHVFKTQTPSHPTFSCLHHCTFNYLSMHTTLLLLYKMYNLPTRGKICHQSIFQGSEILCDGPGVTLGTPQKIIKKYLQIPLLLWNTNWLLAAVGCMTIVCLNLVLTRDKDRIWLRGPFKGDCFCWPH